MAGVGLAIRGFNNSRGLALSGFSSSGVLLTLTASYAYPAAYLALYAATPFVPVTLGGSLDGVRKGGSFADTVRKGGGLDGVRKGGEKG